MSGTTPPKPHVLSLICHVFSTADEVPRKFTPSQTKYGQIDPSNAPFESVKVVYRPKGTFVHAFPLNLAKMLPELLMAQGVIVGHDVGTGISEESEVNDRKRARDDESPGPSKRRTGPTIKKEETSDDVRRQRIQVLQVSRAIEWLLRLVVTDSCECRVI